jgi:anti-sigma B factor antagonist
MKLDISDAGNVTIVEFTGEFDAFNLADTAKQIDGLVDAGDARLVFNLKKLTFINSSALGYLIKIRKKAQGAGGDVALVQPSNFFRKTLVTLGLDKLFCVYESVEDGIRHYHGGLSAPGADLGDDVDETLTGANAILFSLMPAIPGAKRCVGRITSLYSNGLKFRWEVPGWTRDFRPPLSTANFDKEIHPGRKMRIKFRQPFMVQGHYFEMDASIALVARDVLDDGRNEAVFSVRYEGAKPDDLDLLKRFVDDMAELRSEIDQARGQATA